MEPLRKGIVLEIIYEFLSNANLKISISHCFFSQTLQLSTTFIFCKSCFCLLSVKVQVNGTLKN